MGKITKNYKEYLFDRLQDPAQSAGYLNAALEEDDAEGFLLALRDVAEAQGISNLAYASKLNRENVYRILSDQGNPTLSSLVALLSAMGIGLHLKPNGRILAKRLSAKAVSKRGKQSDPSSKSNVGEIASGEMKVKVSSKKAARKLTLKIH
jgi:probable addiction module antidote protein